MSNNWILEEMSLVELYECMHEQEERFAWAIQRDLPISALQAQKSLEEIQDELIFRGYR